jgi:outer membrane lipoprotein SlyB
LIKNKKFLLLFFSLLLNASCNTRPAPETYSVGPIGRAERRVTGEIISVRTVPLLAVSGGGATGLAVGASAGALIGSQTNSAVATIGFAVVGGVVGAIIEQSGSQNIIREYLIRTENGSFISITAQFSPEIDVGRRVLIHYGAPHQIYLL